MQKAEGREGLKRLEDLGEIEALDSAAGDLEVSYHEDHLLVGDTPLFRD